jgi:molybdate transport system ATP-binding protein
LAFSNTARSPQTIRIFPLVRALDPLMRRQLQDELKRMHRDFGTTTLLVSHDLSEIMRLADRVVHLDQGRIVFDGKPQELFGATPDNPRLQLPAEYIDGPDAQGEIRARIDGQVRTIRCGSVPPGVAPGDAILIEVHGGDIRCAF